VRRYWQFYWPLALTGMALVLSIQFQNGVLARYPDAVQELAVFALAGGVFTLFNASMAFVSQLSNVYARSDLGRRRCYRFVLLVSCALMALLLAIALTPPGLQLLQFAYGIDAPLAQRVSDYLLLLSGVVILNGQRHYFTGLLVQAQLTGWTTVANFVYLGTLLLGLLIGFQAGLAAPWVLVGSDALAALVQLLLLLWLNRYYYQSPSQPEHEQLSYGELARFYVPVSTTGVMFALSRPVLYAFVARIPEGLVTIAALRVAFDFGAMFQQASNQFRHFFITFGWDDLAPKRRFMVVVGAVITMLMLVIALTPLSQWIWLSLMGVPEQVGSLATDAFVVLCLMPICILVRNYYHGYLMVVRRTAGMAWASILRVIGIYLYAQGLFSLGWLNHTSAAFGLIVGFVIEAWVVRMIARRQLDFDHF